MSFINVMSFTITLVICALIVFLVVQKFRRREDPEDPPFIDNYMPQFANGHAKGVIKDIDYKEERVIVSFYPRDHKLIRLLKEKKKIEEKPEVVIYDKRFFEANAEGSWSKHRTIYSGFPHREELMPEGMKNTLKGKIILDIINEQTTLKTQSQLDKMKIKSITNFASELAKDEMPRELKSSLKDYVKSMIDLQKPIKRENKE